MRAETKRHWESFGEAVVTCRERRGWLQTDLAKRLEVGQQTVSRWERGTSRPSEAMTTVLAAVLDEYSLDEWKALAGRRP